MSARVVGPLAGVAVAVTLSLLGILVAHLTGGSTHEAVMQMYGAAGVVLLVTITARLEAFGSAGKS